MNKKGIVQGLRLQAGLSVPLLALLTGMALAQDTGAGAEEPVSGVIDDATFLTDPPEPIGDDFVMYPTDPLPPNDTDLIPVEEEILDENGDPVVTIYVSDGIGAEGDPIVVDPVDDPINTDGIGDGLPLDDEIIDLGDGIGDGEPVPDVVIDDEIGGVIGEEPVPEVTMMEFPDSNCGGCELQTMAGGPEVQRTVTGATHSAGGNSNFAAGAEVVSDDNNICFNADLYIPLLCDWQRPFVGDRMP